MISANRLMLGLGLACLALAGCGKSNVEAVQHGYRGTGMAVLYDKSRVESQYAANQQPAAQHRARLHRIRRD